LTMQDVNVLVAFWSRTGATERLALAAALGAVQAKANIRLRWLREAALPHEADSVPEWRENRARMEKEYVAPREADLMWADLIVMATPAKVGRAAPEVQSCLDLMAALHLGGKLGCKVGAALLATAPPGVEGNSTLADLYVALARFHLILVPPRHNFADPLETARLHGQRVAEVTRALKSAPI
jgi:NAD(P)H dehydrogenase (quinone)